QSAREPLQHVLRDTDIASLLKPCVPRESDTSQRCYFFATKPGRPAPSDAGKRDVLRFQSGASGLKEFAKLPPLSWYFGSSGTQCGCHNHAILCRVVCRMADRNERPNPIIT